MIENNYIFINFNLNYIMFRAIKVQNKICSKRQRELDDLKLKNKLSAIKNTVDKK